jgi:6-pyruvoyl-tetrahydropterin synthase
MQKLIFSLAALLLMNQQLAARQADTSRIQVSFNPNLELLGLAYTIVYENPDNDRFDTTDPNWRYGRWLVDEYGRFGESETLDQLLPEIEHLWISDFIPLLLAINDFPNASYPENFDVNQILSFSVEKDTAEAKQIAEWFIAGMNKFYKEVSFGKYLQKTKRFYEAALAEVSANIPSEKVIMAMEAYYGTSFSRYTYSTSLTLPPGMGFAGSVDGGIFNFFTARGQQNLDEMVMGFADAEWLVDYTLHEFGHSFVNPVFDNVSKESLTLTEHLYAPVKQAMISQNYIDWPSCLDEHFVRAGEVMVARQMGDSARANRLIQDYVDNRQFIYLPAILDELTMARQNNLSYVEGMKLSLSALGQLETVVAVPKKVHGIVKDAVSDVPLPYVHIGVPGKDLGVISQLDGSFEIDLSLAEENDSLSFSSVGYRRQSFLIGALKNDSLHVSLEDEEYVLKEITVSDTELVNLAKMGRTNPTKTTTGETEVIDFGFGGEYGIRINTEGRRYVLQDINFHLRFNTTDSVLFRINIYDIENGLPGKSILKENLLMTSHKKEKWISKDVSDRKIVIDQDVIVTYEVLQIWRSSRTHNFLFFTWGDGYEEGSQFHRHSSFDSWSTENGAFPIALYVTGRLF